MRVDDEPGFTDPALLARLEAFARAGDEGEALLPWAARLSPLDRDRLRGDLAVVLAEPEATGEPIDGREISDILQEWAEIAAWDGVLVHHRSVSPDGLFTVQFQPRDTEALNAASPGVRRAMEVVLAEFLTFTPTAGHFLPRGRLKKLTERDTWQLQLPDGYRLRYVVDKTERAVHVVYLGPHPDRDTRGRELTVRVKLNQRPFAAE